MTFKANVKFDEKKWIKKFGKLKEAEINVIIAKYSRLSAQTIVKYAKDLVNRGGVRPAASDFSKRVKTSTFAFGDWSRERSDAGSAKHSGLLISQLYIRKLTVAGASFWRISYKSHPKVNKYLYRVEQPFKIVENRAQIIGTNATSMKVSEAMQALYKTWVSLGIAQFIPVLGSSIVVYRKPILSRAVNETFGKREKIKKIALSKVMAIIKK